MAMPIADKGALTWHWLWTARPVRHPPMSIIQQVPQYLCLLLNGQGEGWLVKCTFQVVHFHLAHTCSLQFQKISMPTPERGGGGEHGFFFCNHTTAASVETLSTLEKKLFETPLSSGSQNFNVFLREQSIKLFEVHTTKSTPQECTEYTSIFVTKVEEWGPLSWFRKKYTCVWVLFYSSSVKIFLSHLKTKKKTNQTDS